MQKMKLSQKDTEIFISGFMCASADWSGRGGGVMMLRLVCVFVNMWEWRCSLLCVIHQSLTVGLLKPSLKIRRTIRHLLYGRATSRASFHLWTFNAKRALRTPIPPSKNYWAWPWRFKWKLLSVHIFIEKSRQHLYTVNNCKEILASQSYLRMWTVRSVCR
jgi:hypothetical protein